MSYFKRQMPVRLTAASWLPASLLIFSLCFAWLLPPSYGQENGPIENTQVVVLALAALVAVSALLQKRLTPPRRKLYALAGLGVLLAIARELSWGRVFYMDKAGNIPPLRALWFGPYVFPVVTVLVIASLGYFVAQGLHKELVAWLKHDRFPLLDILFIIGAIIIADIFEHHSYGLLGDRTEVFEELWELVSYTGVLSFLINIVFNKQFYGGKRIAP